MHRRPSASLAVPLLCIALGAQQQQPPAPQPPSQQPPQQPPPATEKPGAQPAVPAPAAAAQAKPPELPPLTFATALERGQALAPPLPHAAFAPGGHEGAVLLHGEATQTLVRLAPGQEPKPIADARAARAAIGEAVADGAPATFPEWGFADGATLRLVGADAVWHWKPGQPAAERVLRWPAAGAGDDGAVAIAPGDARVAYVRGGDLSFADRSGARRRLTWDASADVVYGGAAHRAEFGITGGLFWSPDGRRLAFYREDLRPIAAYPYADLSTVPPAPAHGRYPMAGNVHSRVQVGVCDTSDGSLRWLEGDPAADLYWTNVTFARDGATLAVALVNRGQDRLELARFDCATGKRLATLLIEEDPQWIEPERGPTFLADGRFLWWSSRDGHRHLWLHAPDGKPLLQVTKGAFDVQELLAVAPDASTLWFAASGEDPRQRHVFAARMDGTEVKQLTRERGSHQGTPSPDCQFAFVTWSNLETPYQSRILNLQTGAVEPLPALPHPLAAFRLPQQRELQVKAEDDTVLYGQVLLPPLHEGKKHPVLLYVYGGPHVQLVTDRWLGGASPWLHALANEGYVVCWLDNRGTPHRGIEFEQKVHRRLGTLEVQDQLRAVEWLKQQPFVDPARIGVTGWSYGGYMTLRLLLLAPETFACGVAGAPVTDWAMYETGWTERYMDTPAENREGYEAASCLPLAGKLKSRLLLVHGSDDRTVPWSHALAFADRCIDAGVFFDFFPYPMQTHRLVGPDRKHFLASMKRWLDERLKPGT